MEGSQKMANLVLLLHADGNRSCVRVSNVLRQATLSVRPLCVYPIDRIDVNHTSNYYFDQVSLVGGLLGLEKYNVMKFRFLNILRIYTKLHYV